MTFILKAILRALCGAISFLGIASCTTEAPPAPAIAGLAGDPQDSWASVLQRYVDDQGRVNFIGLSKDRAALDNYVRYVYRVSPLSDPSAFPSREQRLAYYINSYNALSMFNVIDSGIPDALTGIRKLAFFFIKEFRIGGREMSLYAYENDVIRPLGEPRVHFALNCMAVSCPRLPREPFTAENLDAELTRQAREFFADARNLVVDQPARRIRVNEILRFYTDDFTRVAPSLIAYVNRYHTPPIPDDFRVEFIPYDWHVNRQPAG